jgi:hypothetical protein
MVTRFRLLYLNRLLYFILFYFSFWLKRARWFCSSLHTAMPRRSARLAASAGKKRRRVVTVCDSSDSSDGEVVTVDSSDDEVVVVADKKAVDAQRGPSHVIPAKEESQGLTIPLPRLAII